MNPATNNVNLVPTFLEGGGQMKLAKVTGAKLSESLKIRPSYYQILP